jgi:hypothetical protein
MQRALHACASVFAVPTREADKKSRNPFAAASSNDSRRLTVAEVWLPAADAYCAYKPMPYDAPSWAMTSVLYAARPQEGYFKLSDPGTIRVLDDGRVKFSASAGGAHRYLILDPAQQERIIKTYGEIASAKPVVRQFRFRKKDAKLEEAAPKALDPKPADVKP